MKKKHISVVSILSIIMFVLSIIIPAILIVLCLIGAAGTDSVGADQGYGWGILLVSIAGAIGFAYYLTVMIISLVLDFKSNSKIGKNVCIPIALVAPFIFFGAIMLISNVKDSKKNYTMADLKVEFPKEMKRSGYRSNIYDSGFHMLTFFDRWEEDSTCSITIKYDDYDKNKSAIENMKDTVEDKFIAKNVTLIDFLNSSYYTSQKKYNNISWDYISYPNNYYKVYGTSYNNKYYVVQVSDDHTSHSKCTDYEEEFLNNLEFKK